MRLWVVYFIIFGCLIIIILYVFKFLRLYWICGLCRVKMFVVRKEFILWFILWSNVIEKMRVNLFKRVELFNCVFNSFFYFFNFLKVKNWIERGVEYDDR